MSFTSPLDDSGYRCCRRDQVRTTQLIRALRQLDVPIDEVRCLLTRHEDGENLASALHAHLKVAERRPEIQGSVLHSLLAPLTGGAGVNHILGDRCAAGGLARGYYVLDIPEAAYAGTMMEGETAALPEIHTAYDAVAGRITELSACRTAVSTATKKPTMSGSGSRGPGATYMSFAERSPQSYGSEATRVPSAPDRAADRGAPR